MPEHLEEQLREGERHARFLRFFGGLDAGELRLVDGPLGLFQGGYLSPAPRQLQVRERTIYDTDEQKRDQERATPREHKKEQRHRDRSLRLVVAERSYCFGIYTL